MRRLLLGCLLGFIWPAWAQTETPQPTPRCNLVLVRTIDEPGTARERVSQALTAAGYVVEPSTGQVLATRPKRLTRQVRVVVRVAVAPVVGGTLVQYWGGYAWGEAEAPLAPIVFQGRGNNPARIAWEALAAVAVYPGGVVSYHRR